MFLCVNKQLIYLDIWYAHQTFYVSRSFVVVMGETLVIFSVLIFSATFNLSKHFVHVSLRGK